jgi:hypothetical protein
MSCVCEKCGKPAACGERFCDQCFIDETRNDEASKNLDKGGHFYEKTKDES